MTTRDKNYPSPERHNPFADRLLDYVRGDVDPAERVEIEARIAGDPTVSAEAKRLSALFAAARAAHDLEFDPAAGTRLAARIRHRVQREEARTLPEVPLPASSRIRWARFFAIAVAAHVVLLGVFSLVVKERSLPPEEVDMSIGVRTSSEPETGVVADAPPVEPTLSDALLPIEDLFRREARGAMSDESVAILSDEAASRSALPAFARAAVARSSDLAKEAIFARIGQKDDLKQVQSSLRALALRQESNGSFPAGRAASRVRVTAAALLAFLGDGNTSRRGDQRDVIEKGVQWLRNHASDAQDAEDRALVLSVFTEDFAFTSGDLQVAEATARKREIATLVAKIERSDAASPWVGIALDGVARAGLRGRAKGETEGGGWARAYAAMPATSPEPRTAVVTGTALLLAKGDSFLDWNRRVTGELKSRLSPDGLARSARPSDPSVAAVGDRVEETAWILLALEVPYRTY